ncbi:MAG: SDR family NAD(P)-dependent oxidoreductase [Alphaproteobacteria bacterium]|nr:SDR family NAD(P)-dependent oxidoreductase [Alphaproteobacteria bacterium]
MTATSTTTDTPRWALVAGGTTTVGAAFAERAAASGLHVVVVARGVERLRAVADGLRARHGVEVVPVALDLLADGAVEALQEAVGDRAIDLMVVNANLHRIGSFADQPLDLKVRMLRMDLEMPVRLTHAFGPGMVARGRGRIVFVNALNALTALENDAVFQGAKAGLRVFAESVGLEYARAGVHVATALVAGIQGSDSFASKMSPRTQRWVRLVGGSMSAEAIVDDCWRQLARGRTELVPDGRVGLLWSAGKAMDASRLLGWRWLRWAWSALFGRLLDGDGG